jgi:hypothetical protein
MSLKVWQVAGGKLAQVSQEGSFQSQVLSLIILLIQVLFLQHIKMKLNVSCFFTLFCKYIWCSHMLQHKTFSEIQISMPLYIKYNNSNRTSQYYFRKISAIDEHYKVLV